MHSSTSSFDRLVVAACWARISGAALGITLLLALALELRLAQLGYRPTALDSPQRWAEQRARADTLGKDAVILIGASRIQLDIDLQHMRQDMHLEPVQLAVDGSSFVPVLESLADDPSVNGTVIVDFTPDALLSAVSKKFGHAAEMVRSYGKAASHEHADFSQEHIEHAIAMAIREHMRTYADGATPWQSLLVRVGANQESEQYLTTAADRSRAANYGILPMPETYYRRVIRDLNAEGRIDPLGANAATQIEAAIRNLPAYDDANAAQGAAYINTLLTRLESRGARVIVVKMPISGYIRQIEAKRFPDEKFLGMFERSTGRHVFVADDDATLASFRCPDGSHLDARDRTAFTAAFDRAAGLVAPDRD